MEIRCKNHAYGGESETERAQRETLFLAEMIGNRTGRDAAGNAADQRAPGGPPDAGRIQMKALAQESNGAADDNVVVSEQKAAKRGDTGCNDERGARRRRRGGGVQLTCLWPRARRRNFGRTRRPPSPPA